MKNDSLFLLIVCFLLVLNASPSGAKLVRFQSRLLGKEEMYDSLRRGQVFASLAMLVFVLPQTLRALFETAGSPAIEAGYLAVMCLLLVLSASPVGSRLLRSRLSRLGREEAFDEVRKGQVYGSLFVLIFVLPQAFEAWKEVL